MSNPKRHFLGTVGLWGCMAFHSPRDTRDRDLKGVGVKMWVDWKVSGSRAVQGHAHL